MASKKDELEGQIKRINDALAKLESVTNSADRSEQLKQIKDLTKAAEDYADAEGVTDATLKKQLKTIKTTNTELSSMLLVNKGIVKTFKEMSKESRTFAVSTSEWFTKGEELAKQYLSVSKNIGLSEQRTRTLSRSFNATVGQALKLGIGLDGVREIFDTFAESSGRARILSEEEGENIAKVAAGTGLYASEASKLAEQFDLMGISSEKTVGFINEAIGSSREMGLNSNKVIKTLQSNMKSMQQYSFASGVKGMVNMAKQAVKMRVDVSEILQMSDKFYQPEAAIEAAANLQLLGGDIAEAFGDPFQVMYEARNKPEELAKRVGKMTENMVSFNEETGEFDMPAEARMQLQAVSKELGIGMDSLTEMTRQASKIKSIRMDVSGNILDEDMRDGIAGMARMKDGKWVVDFEEGGKTMTKSINDLSKEQGKLLVDQKKEFEDKSEKDLLQDIALNTQTFSERMTNNQSSRQYDFAGQIDVYESTMEGFLDETITTYDDGLKNMFSALNKSIGDNGGIGQVMKDAFGVDDASGENLISEGVRTIFDKITNAITEGGASGDGFSVDSLSSKVTDAKIYVKGLFGAEDVSMDVGGKTLVTGPAGTFTLDDKDSYYGKDGQFTAGTNLGIDENIKNGSTAKSSSKVEVVNKHEGNVTATIVIKSDNPNQLVDKDYISKVVTKMFNNGGQPDGARLPQEGGTNVLQSS